MRYCEQLTGESWAINLRKLLIEGKVKVAEAKAEGKTSLEKSTVDGLLKRYDEQIQKGLESFPVKPHEAGKKGRQKQHEATTSWCGYEISKTKSGDSSQIGMYHLITIKLNVWFDL